MTTEQPRLIGEDSLETLRSVALAVSILAPRFRRLAQPDRDAIAELVQHWCTVDDREEQDSAIRAIEELLAQVPVSVRPLLEGKAKPLSGKRRTWVEHVGRRIRELREQAGLNQAELGERSGLTQSHVSRLENAEHTPTHLTLTKIAKALGIDVKMLDHVVD
jgi:DNA-binding XRE family transcriptional regulator